MKKIGNKQLAVHNVLASQIPSNPTVSFGVNLTRAGAKQGAGDRAELFAHCGQCGQQPVGQGWAGQGVIRLHGTWTTAFRGSSVGWLHPRSEETSFVSHKEFLNPPAQIFA